MVMPVKEETLHTLSPLSLVAWAHVVRALLSLPPPHLSLLAAARVCDLSTFFPLAYY